MGWLQFVSGPFTLTFQHLGMFLWKMRLASAIALAVEQPMNQLDLKPVIEPGHDTGAGIVVVDDTYAEGTSSAAQQWLTRTGYKILVVGGSVIGDAV